MKINNEQMKVHKIEEKVLENAKEIISSMNNKLLEYKLPKFSNIYVVFRDDGWKEEGDESVFLSIINEEQFSPNIHCQDYFNKIYKLYFDMYSIEEKYKNIRANYDFLPINNLGHKFIPINTRDFQGKDIPTNAVKDKFTVLIALGNASGSLIENIRNYGNSFDSEYEVIYIWGDSPGEFEYFAKEYPIIRELNCRFLIHCTEYSAVINRIEYKRLVIINKNEQIIFNSHYVDFNNEDTEEPGELMKFAKENEYSFSAEKFANSQYKTIMLDNILNFRDNDYFETKNGFDKSLYDVHIFKVNENLDFNLVYHNRFE